MTDTLQTEFNTVTRRLLRAVAQYGARPALSTKPAGAKTWETLTYADVGEQVRQLSLGLRALGVERGDRVALLSENRPEWVVADQAIMAAGAVTVPIYPTLPPSQVAYILADSGSKALIASDAKQLAKIDLSGGAYPDLKTLMTMDADAATGGARPLAAVMADGATAQFDEGYEARAQSINPDDLMSIVYTSGTTGSPKGVMLTHGCMVASLVGAATDLPQYRPPQETMLSFLPLCHIFERITYTLALTNGAHTYFNDSIFKIVDNMAEVKATVMVNVPRVYESIHDRVIEGLAKAPARRQKIAHWALGIGETVALRQNAGQWVNPVLKVQHMVADKLVLSKVRARFGSHVNFLASGGAPINPLTTRFFYAIGIPMIEVWGLTETGLATITPWGRVKIGTVGKVSANTSVMAAPDGELLIKGPNVMRGYWHNDEATAEAIDKDGWFHSGDIGEIDKDGYVKITDRKKDLLVLANGKKVAPQPIEVMLKRSRYISEIVLLGDKSETVKALVVPNFDGIKAWAKEQGKESADNGKLIADPAVRKLIKSDIDAHSKDLADFERVKRIALIDHAFTIEGGELTPTLKVKRKVVAEKFGHLLEKE